MHGVGGSFSLPQIKYGSPYQQQHTPSSVQIFDNSDSPSPTLHRSGFIGQGNMSSNASLASSSELHMNTNTSEVDEVSTPCEKYMIRGYSGFRPTRKNVVGEPSIPSEEKQLRLRMEQTTNTMSRGSPGTNSPSIAGGRSYFSPASSVLYDTGKHQAVVIENNVEFVTQASPNHYHQKAMIGSSGASTASNSAASVGHEPAAFNQFRLYAKHMDIVERYNTAIQQLLGRGQTQDMLLRIVQSKLSEKVHSYASQQIRMRKLFEAFDFNGDGVLDEREFRVCLEKMNIQLDDVQSLALFAYFDRDNSGFIPWNSFAENAMIQNPRGGTGVLPKMITSVSTEPISVAAGHRLFPQAI